MIFISKINPIGFLQNVNLNNKPLFWQGNFKQVDNVDLCQFMPLNEEVVIAIQTSLPQAPIITTSANVTSQLVDITPVGWSGAGVKVFKITFVFSKIGEEHIYLNDGLSLYESYTLNVGENIEDYIRLEASHSENDFGYFQGIPMIHYLNGELVEDVPTSEIVSYQNDRGKLVKLRSTPNDSWKLKLFRLKPTEVTKINHLFALDKIIINHIEYQNEEAPSVTRFDKSNIFDMDITLQEVNNNYSMPTVDILPDMNENFNLWLHESSNSIGVTTNGFWWFNWNNPLVLHYVHYGSTTITLDEYGGHYGIIMESTKVRPMVFSGNDIIRLDVEDLGEAESIASLVGGIDVLEELNFNCSLIRIKYARIMCNDCGNLKYVRATYPDMPNLLDFEWAFQACYKIEEIAPFDTPKCENFYATWAGLELMTEIYVNMKNAKDVKKALGYMTALTTIHGYIDTRQSINNDDIFYHSDNITTPDQQQQTDLSSINGAYYENI